MTQLPRENIYGHTKKLRFMLEQLNQYVITHAQPISILDFGCGNGSAVSQFLIRDNIKYYGVDIHQPSLEYARKHFATSNAYFLDRIPEGARFDVLVYSDNLEHLDDPISFLKYHHTFLKSGGILIGSVPNGYGPFEIEKKIDHWFRLSLLSVPVFRAMGKVRRMISRKKKMTAQSETTIPYNYASGHLQFFTKHTLASVLKEGGFELTHLRHGSFIGAPFSELFLRGEQIAKWNAKAADYLPYWLVSTWYFVAEKR